jgi:hypothetical protein
MTNAEKVIKNKMGLIKLAEQLGNVSQACKIIGYSRDSFYRFKELYDEQGAEGLRELSRRKPNPKNRVDPVVEAAVLAIALENPALGQLRVSNTLKQEGIFISPGGVRSIWLRHGLETFKKRLKEDAGRKSRCRQLGVDRRSIAGDGTSQRAKRSTR